MFQALKLLFQFSTMFLKHFLFFCKSLGVKRHPLPGTVNPLFNFFTPLSISISNRWKHFRQNLEWHFGNLIKLWKFCEPESLSRKASLATILSGFITAIRTYLLIADVIRRKLGTDLINSSPGGFSAQDNWCKQNQAMPRKLFTLQPLPDLYTQCLMIQIRMSGTLLYQFMTAGHLQEFNTFVEQL